MLQACLNGGRRRDEAAGVPLSPEELATDAVAVLEAGAETLHLHPRDANGEQSLQPDDVTRALMAVRAAVPGTPVGIGTGTDIPPCGRARHADIAAWTVLPDYVSVNLNDEDAPDGMAMMAARGIGIEAGIWSVEDAERYVALPDRPEPLRILVEIVEFAVEEAARQTDAVLDFLSRAGISAPILLHGFDDTAWPCLRDAARRGCDTRVGFEDTLVLPDGGPAADNAALVAAARAIMAGEG